MFQDFCQLFNGQYYSLNTDDNDIFAKTLKFQKKITMIRKAGFYPFFQALENNLGPEAVIKGKKVIMLGSNNYLGLTMHPKVREAAISAIKSYGTSMTGSRLLNGTLELHEVFEEEIAEFLGKEAALVFTTGYQANLGIITALANHNSIVFLDKLNHASLFDAVKLSEARAVFFDHNDVSNLEMVLEEAPNRKTKLVAVDGVFSMEGDISPLPKIASLCKKYKARLLVDDAHALGVLGDKGQGTAAHFGLNDEVDLVMSTFSKSLASTGGYVAGKMEVIDYIKHFGRSIVFSASLTPANLAAARQALKILIEEPERMLLVKKNATKLKNGLIDMGWGVGSSETPIIPILIGDEFTTFQIWKELIDAGVYVNPVMYPAVNINKAILRISTMATHTENHLNRALDIFQTIKKRHKI